MKTKLLCIIVASLFANCVSAQEQYIQVKTVNNGRKSIDITLTNTTDQKMRIYCIMNESHINSRFSISFLDNNGKTVTYRDNVLLIRDESPWKMLLIKPHSSVTIQYTISSLMRGIKEEDSSYYSVKTIKVKYYIRYFFPDADRSSSFAGFFVYEMTTDPIAF